MRRNNVFNKLARLAAGSLIPGVLSALPSSPDVVSGEVAIHVEAQNTMVIEASDGAIIRYDTFNIGSTETVRFLQPGPSSVVLNRVTGPDVSTILGKMESNGTVFLVNTSGVFFGKDAQVSTGSLIVSSLHIDEVDFSEGRYRFAVDGTKEIGEILNFGTLSAREGGSIALLGPKVRNEGTVLADRGSILLGSAERVTLDFTGDGLIRFILDGELEEPFLEQAGTVAASCGTVRLALGRVKEVIRSVVNTDDLPVAQTLVRENGIVRLVSGSVTTARSVSVDGVEGSTIVCEGKVDVSDAEGFGGTIRLLGEKISVDGAVLDASGRSSGGTLLIGGEAKGLGDLFTASETIVTKNSLLSADAYEEGPGGTIVVWSDGATRFEGKATARGGDFGGDGGFVETSGRRELGVGSGSVDTSALKGLQGTWLLDPYQIVINNTGSDLLSGASIATDLSSSLTINASSLASATSNVVLSALAENGSITFADGTTLTLPSGYGIEMDVDTATGSINIGDAVAIETLGGSVLFNGPVVLTGNSASVTTSLSGGSGDISFSSTLDGSPSFSSDFTLDAGTAGTVTFDASVGGNAPLGAIDVTAAAFDVGSGIYTKGGSVSVAAATTLTGNCMIDTTSAGSYTGGDISFTGSGSTVDGPYMLITDSGVGTTRFEGDVGSTVSLYSYKAKGSGTVVLGSFSADGNTLIYESPVVVGADVTFTDNGTSGVYFLSTINGDGVSPWTVTVSAPVGTAYFVGAVGGSVPLAALTVSASEIVQGNPVTLQNSSGSDSALTYSGLLGINVGGDITAGVSTTSRGTLTFNNPVTFSANTGATATDGVVTLTVVSGTLTDGSVSLSGVSQGSGNLSIVGDARTTVSLTDGSVTLSTLSVVADSISQDANGSISATGDVTLDCSSGAVGKTLTLAAPVTTTTGSITLKGGATTASVTSNLSTGGGNITLTPTLTTPISYAGVISTGGGTLTCNASTGNESLLLTGAVSIDVGSGSAVVTGSITGAYDLSVTGSSIGTLELEGAVGSTPLTSLLVDIGTVIQSSTVAVAGPVSYICPSDISLGGNITTTGSSGTITFTGPTTLTSNVTISSASGNKALSFVGSSSTIDGSHTLSLASGSGNISLGGAIGQSTALTSLATASTGTSLIGSSITTTGTQTYGASSGTGNILLTGPVNLTTTNSGITFRGTIDGAQTLLVNAGTGTVTYGGIVGGSTPLVSLNTIAGSIVLDSTISTQ